MQITEKSNARVFVLEVSEHELQLIQRGLYVDNAPVGADSPPESAPDIEEEAENLKLHNAVFDFMDVKGVEKL